MKRFNRDDGVALTSVVIVAFILMLLVGSTLAFAVNSQDLARRDQDWNAAIAAADAGIDDYIYRLNRVDSYWQYNASTPPPDGNRAFTQWVAVPGAPNNASFRYTVDRSTFATDGILKIASTGKVGNVTRTVYANLRRRNFLDYLYFTDFETKDPAIYSSADGDSFTPAQAQVQCARHVWDSPARNTSCTNIFFFTRDVIRGPLHSNDAIRMSGSPQFQGATTTSWIGTDDNPITPLRWIGPTGVKGSGATPSFARPQDIDWSAFLTMPPSNTTIKNQTNPALGGTGCLFTGPTRIVLNSSGTMNVTSPLSSGGNCSTGTNRPLPPNGVIYVENRSGSCPRTPATHPLGYGVPMNDITPYGPCIGDAFISGTLRGRLTIASENNIVVVGDTMYSTGTNGTDLLGLVANNYVEIFHPVRCTNTSGGNCTGWADITSASSSIAPRLPFTNARLQAAVLSVAHSFRVQNYRLPANDTCKGTLSVFGAIAQKYRGIVGTFSGNDCNTGYEKDYVYDQRLRYQSPPHFLDPVRSAWGLRTWAEVQGCYTTAGVLRDPSGTPRQCPLPTGDGS
jgi:hypothetical protein